MENIWRFKIRLFRVITTTNSARSEAAFVCVGEYLDFFTLMQAEVRSGATLPETALECNRVVVTNRTRGHPSHLDVLAL